MAGEELCKTEKAVNSIQSASSSSSSSDKRKYDVFISFRGEDTRLSFVDHLSVALDQNKIFSFRDDKDLKKGNTIAPELLKAIEESRVSLVILSPNYASSTWCLDELVKILHCRQDMGQVLLPIFYQVQPSDVRNKNGRFLKAVEEHGLVHPNKVDRWKAALIEVSSIAGWVTKDKREANIVNDIVKFVLKCLKWMREKAGRENFVKELKDFAADVETLLDEWKDKVANMFDKLQEIAEDVENVLDEFGDGPEDEAANESEEEVIPSWMNEWFADDD
ncbi:toll/interleukin-1 receptor-like protein [Rosa sericea]